ncbi:MAG: gamma-glutamylcyclotransferase family protein [Hyphomicrobiales bacterium]
MSETFHYFGYGSLINDQTRPPALIAQNAVLNGWRREWRVTGALSTSWDATHNICALSVRPDSQCSIAGVLVEEPVGNLASLDEREVRYQRLDVEVETQSGNRQASYVYQALKEHSDWGSADAPICLSYVDCVLQGVIHRFGEEALGAFFETTDGWHVPILNDRSQPIYPRSIVLSSRETELIDAQLKAYDVCWK